MRQIPSILLLLIFAVFSIAQTYNTGNTSNIALVSKYGGAYFYTSSSGSPTPIVIDVAGQYHGLSLATSGTHESGWTHKVGTGPVTISGVTDNGGVVPNTILVTTSAPHGFDVGDYVRHTGFTTRTTYQGAYKILTTPLSTTYTVARAYNTSTDTGWAKRSFSLRANTGSAGMYLVQFTVSIQCDANTTDLRFEGVQNVTDLDNIVGQALYTTQNRPQVIAGAGLVSVADDDVLWMQVKNLTDDSDLKIWTINFVATRL